MPLVQDLRTALTVADTLGPKGLLISIASHPVETNGTEAKVSTPGVPAFVMPSLVPSTVNYPVSR